MAKKHMISGLFAMVLTSAALAGGHYVEVWNPPETSGDPVAKHKAKVPTRSHKLMKRRRASTRTASVRVRRSNPIAADPSGPHTAAASAPTFDDIPRRITPEGNVLRVKNIRRAAEIER